MYKNEVFFDIETQKLFSEIEDFDPGKLKLSIVSAYVRKVDLSGTETEGQMFSFWENDLASLWTHFQNADRIVGFNSIKFDVAVLQPYTQIPLLKFNHFDILDEVKKAFGKRISLNDIVKETLGVQKIDVGTNAVAYWTRGDRKSLAKLQKYCEADVLLTRDLYDFAFKNKRLKFKDKWNTVREIKVDFSYPTAEDPNKQIGLF